MATEEKKVRLAGKYRRLDQIEYHRAVLKTDPDARHYARWRLEMFHKWTPSWAWKQMPYRRWWPRRIHKPRINASVDDRAWEQLICAPVYWSYKPLKK